MKSGKYQYSMVMIIELVVYWIMKYFKDNYRWTAVDLNKQKALDADPRAIQQIVFQGVVGGANNTKIRLYTILEQSKETMLEFSKGTAKVLWLHVNGWIQ